MNHPTHHHHCHECGEEILHEHEHHHEHEHGEGHLIAPEHSSTHAVSAPLVSDKKFFFSVLITIAFIAYLLGSGAFKLPTSLSTAKDDTAAVGGGDAELQAAVFPSKGIRTEAKWGHVIPQLVDYGVIDGAKFASAFNQGGAKLSGQENVILNQPQDDLPITFTTENSRFTVDVLWALGLAQQSDVLDKGQMRTSGTPTEQFASTGGWTLGVSSSAMDYYSKWNLLGLTADDQARVQKIAEGVYRPCCGNSTAFPDCNHGMAMLGLIELMVSQGVSDNDIFAAARAANTYWFPDTYLEMATYFTKVQNTSWNKVDDRTVVGKDYASGQGARKVTQALQGANLLPPPPKGGGSCGA